MDLLNNPFQPCSDQTLTILRGRSFECRRNTFRATAEENMIFLSELANVRD